MKFLPVFLLLAACGGSGSQNFDRNVYVNVVQGFPHGSASYTQWAGRDPAVIEVSDSVMGADEDYLDALLMHELVHACTRTTGHDSDSSCYTYEGGLPVPYVHPPCPAEIAKVQATTGTFILHSFDFWLVDNVVWAATEWNTWAGRTVFVVNP